MTSEGSGQPAIIRTGAIRRSASIARSIPASSTSWCVTKRTVSTSMVPARTPSAASASSRFAGSASARAHDVRLDGRRINAPGEPLGQRLRRGAAPGVVVGQPFDHRLQRDDAGGGDDARLAHPTTETRPIGPRLVDEIARPAEQRTHGRAQPLRQAEHRGVGARGQLARRHPERDRRVPDAGTVAVQRQLLRARDVGDRVDLDEPPRAPARGHVRVLEGERGDRRQVVGLPGDGRRHVVGGERPAAVGQRPQLHPRVPCRSGARSGTRGPARRTALRYPVARAAGARAGSPSCPRARTARRPCRATRPRATPAGSPSGPRRTRRRRPRHRPSRAASPESARSPCRIAGRRRRRVRSSRQPISAGAGRVPLARG